MLDNIPWQMLSKHSLSIMLYNAIEGAAKVPATHLFGSADNFLRNLNTSPHVEAHLFVDIGKSFVKWKAWISWSTIALAIHGFSSWISVWLRKIGCDQSIKTTFGATISWRTSYQMGAKSAFSISSTSTHANALQACHGVAFATWMSSKSWRIYLCKTVFQATFVWTMVASLQPKIFGNGFLI